MDDANEELLEWINKLDDEDHLICVQRACISLGWAHDLEPDGEVLVDGDPDSEEFRLAVWQEYGRMFVGDLLEDLAEEGVVELSHVNNDGELVYKPTED